MADNFKVETQRPVVTVVPGGQVQDAMEITFVTIPHGQPGKVRIPTSAYTPTEVAKVLHDAAAQIIAVQDL